MPPHKELVMSNEQEVPTEEATPEVEAAPVVSKSVRSVKLTVGRAKKSKATIAKAITVAYSLPYVDGDVVATANLYKLTNGQAVTTLLGAIAVAYAEPLRNHIATQAEAGLTGDKLSASVAAKITTMRAEGKTARLTADEKLGKLASAAGITAEQAAAALKLAGIKL